MISFLAGAGGILVGAGLGYWFGRREARAAVGGAVHVPVPAADAACPPERRPAGVREDAGPVELGRDSADAPEEQPDESPAKSAGEAAGLEPLYEGGTVEEERLFGEETCRSIEREMEIYDRVFIYTRFALLTAAATQMPPEKLKELMQQLLAQLFGGEEYRQACEYLNRILMQAQGRPV